MKKLCSSFILILMLVCWVATAATPYMGLSLPTVSSTPGPQWATLLNNAFTTVDSHDHTTGKGVPIPSAGISINSNLTFNNYAATNLASAQFTSQGSSLSISNGFSVVNGAPYFNDSGGNPLPLVAYAGQATVGDILYATSATTWGRLGAGTSGTFLKSNGPGSAPSYASAGNTTPYASKTHSNTGYTLTSTDGTIVWTLTNGSNDTYTLPLASSVGAGITYTVKLLNTTASANTLTGSTTGGDNITLANGDTLQTSYAHKYAGDLISYQSNGSSLWQVTKVLKHPTFTSYTSGSGTYTTPKGVTYLKIKMVGGGGGGGALTTNSGGGGGDTTFGTATAGAGGGGGPGGGANGSGGSATLGSDMSGVAIHGQPGGEGVGTGTPSGGGGMSPYFGGGGQMSSGNGRDAQANTGGGGSGASGGSQSSNGGGSGGFIEATIVAPSATYSYGVGSAGSAGTSGGKPGGAGAAGQILIEEYYE